MGAGGSGFWARGCVGGVRGFLEASHWLLERAAE